MKRFFLATMMALCVFQFSGYAQKTDLNAAIPVNSEVKIGHLDNGLKYYLIPNKRPEKKVELRMVVNAGAIQEDNDQKGLAHFMEHMNFNGLKNFPHNDIVHYLQSIGVEFGADLNAYTSFDETVFILPVPSDDKAKVERAFQIIADWSGNALLDDQEIDKERGVVLEESRLGKGADDRMMKKWLPRLFNGSLYADRLPIGEDEILKNFKHEVLRRFHHDWYRPDLQAVMVVGDMDMKEAERLIKEKFGAFKNPANERKREALINIPTRTKNETMVLSDKEAPYTQIQIVGNLKPSKEAKTANDYRDNLITGLFNQMISARFDELKNSATPPFIYGSGNQGNFWVRGWETFSCFAICGGKDIKSAVEALVTESMRAKKFGFTQAELDRAKANLISGYQKSYNERDKTESGARIDEMVRNFLQQEPIPGITWEYKFANETVPTITLNEVNKVAENITFDKQYFSFITAKEEPGLPSNADLANWIEGALKTNVQAYTEKAIASSLLEKTPTAGTVVKTEKNDKLGTTTYTLSNGAVVTLKPTDFKNDEIKLTATRMGGASMYTAPDYQSADYSNNVVDEMGYGNFSNTDLTKFLAGKTVSVDPAVEEYSETINGNSTIKDLKTMFELLYLKCTSPRNDMTAFASFVSREKQQYEAMKQNPQYAFMDAQNVDFYQNHPRSHQIPESADFDKINVEHAVNFYNQRLGNANGMHYFIVGSFKNNDILPLINTYIGGMPSAPIDIKINDMNMIPKPGVNTFTFKKGKEAQSMLMHKTFADMPYNADDNFILNQLNEVVNNKITEILREKMSGIYGGGMGGSISKFPKEQLMIQTYLPCGPENVDKLDKAMLQILADVKKPNGITAKDWNEVKQTSLQKNKVRIQTNDFWLGYLKDASQKGYDPERVLNYEKFIAEVTPQKLIAAANKFYKLNNLYKAIWLPESK